MTRRSLVSLFALPGAFAQSQPADAYTTFDSDGTAHIKRAVPVPKTISSEAQALMISGRWMPPSGTEEATSYKERMNATYPVHVEATTFAGVKVWSVTPKRPAANKRDRLLICLHGGGFTSDSGSLTESIPVAALTGTKVISVQYRLAPQFPFPAAVEDSAAVYSAALKTYSPGKIAIYGTSAGAVLAAQTAVQVRKSGLPLPAALGFFSGYVDLARYGDFEISVWRRRTEGFQLHDRTAQGIGDGSLCG